MSRNSLVRKVDAHPMSFRNRPRSYLLTRSGATGATNKHVEAFALIVSPSPLKVS